MINLSKRLSMVASLLERGNVICDVGCDHAYLPIYLIDSGVFDKALALDINEGPLDKARDNIIKYNMESEIETRLSDGVRNLRTKETDALTICGMGGNVMIHIFDEGRDIIRDINQVIIQPQSEYMKLYDFLIRNGYSIDDEVATIDLDKFYFAWKIRYIGRNSQLLNAKLINLGFYYSEVLSEKRDEIYRKYLVSYYNSIEKAMETMKVNSPHNKRINILIKEMETIDKMLNQYYN